MAAAVAVVSLGMWNVVSNRLLPASRYVPANLLAAVGSYTLARLVGVDNSGLGMRSADIPRGARWGGVGAVMVGTGAFVSSRMPMTRHLFDDARAQPHDIYYQVLVRIPLGTVLLEEVAFRGVVPALFSERRTLPSTPAAALFGLWRVLPTLDTMTINNVTTRRARIAGVVGAVAVTAVAGWALDRLRLRSRSLLAPVMVHWSANAVAYALAARRRR